tara:strand:+ start:1709 stop:2362 length:654 start_codon:yes stop_codon:yes gene_type:complete
MINNMNNQQKINELLDTPRMFYSKHVIQNSNRGLYDLIKDVITSETVMVEIGSFSGVSSELFAIHCKNIYCVDKWEPYSDIQEAAKLQEAERRFDNILTVYKNIHKLKMSSEKGSEQFQDCSLDFVYIDASHDYDNVKKDIENWLPKIKSGGIIAGHDYYESQPGFYPGISAPYGAPPPTRSCIPGYAGYPGLTKAVNEILGKQLTVYDDSSWYKRV